MPRKTVLSLISERAVPDPAAMIGSTAELEALTPLPAPGQDVLAALRAQNAQLVQLAADARRRAENVESTLHETQAAAATDRQAFERQRAEIARQASGEVAKARTEAATAVKAAIAQSAVAEKTAVAAAHVQRATGMLAQFGMFLFDRAPVLLTLIGAYLLARDMLPTPGPLQLGLLGIYGGSAVLPAVWLATRRG